MQLLLKRDTFSFLFPHCPPAGGGGGAFKATVKRDASSFHFSPSASFLGKGGEGGCQTDA